MRIIVSFEENKYGFRLSYEPATLDAQNSWENFIAETLKIFFKSTRAILITDTPQPYSLIRSLEESSFYTKNNNITYAITPLNDIDNLIVETVGDEEFSRGLLWICQSTSGKDNIIQDSIVKQLIASKDNATLFNTFFASNNGSLLFYNGEKSSFLNAIDIAATLTNTELNKR